MSEPKAASAGGKKKNQKKVTLSLQEFNKTVLPEHDPQSQWGDIDINEEEEYDHREQSSNTPSDSYQNRQNSNRREYGGYRDNQRDNYRDNYQRENRDRPQRDNRDRKHNEIPNNPPFVAYVGNLSYSVTKEDLEDFFRANCDVEDVRLIVDNNSPDKRSKGFGYITFRTKEDLETALTADNADLGGRPIRVDVSTPRENQSSSSQRGDRGERDTFIRRENRFEQSRADSADTWERGKVVVAKPADLPPRREFKSDRPRRDNRPPRDEERKEEEVKERQPLKLQPKSSSSDSSSESPSAKPKANPFGEAKPRDERAFEERRQKELAERVVTQEPSSDSPKEETPKSNNNDSKYRPPRGNNSGKQFNFSNRGNNNNNQRNPKKKGPRSEIQPDSDGFVPTSKAAPSQSVQSTPAPASGPSIKNKFSALSNE